MKPTDILKDEHRVILKALDIIDFISELVEKGGSYAVEDIRRLIDFIRNFADRCHHAKEENLLFKSMVEYGVPEKGGPIEVMLYEHELGRKYVKNMEKALIDKTPSVVTFINNARLYTSLLREHINKEDNILYMIADMHIDEEGQKTLLKRFGEVEKEEIGEGVHERYHNLIKSMEKKYLIDYKSDAGCC